MTSNSGGSKKTSGKSNQSKSRNTSRKTGTGVRKTAKRSSSKRKAYISPVKIILFCGSVIVFCLFLLLLTTIMQPSGIESVREDPVVTVNDSKREEEKVTETKSSEKKVVQTKEAEKQNSAKSAQKDTSKTEAGITPKISEKKTETSSKTQTKKTNTVADVTTPAEVQTKKVTEEKKETVKSSSDKTEPSVAVKKKSYNFPSAKNNATLVFLFDDGGQNLGHLDKFLTLPFPITVAVLPQLQYSVQSAQKIRASGNELMLHQPMQSVNPSTNPGPGAIKPEMNELQVAAMLFQNINQIGPIAGLNNHEGSAITADAEKMAVVMKICSDENIFFLDSRTNADTKVPYVAGEMGYSYYERNIFLDNEKTNANALKELRKGLDIANKNGSVIMIGHVWSANFLPAFLKDVYPELKEKGYKFSVVSKSQHNGRK